MGKVCTKCKTENPLNQFRKRRGGGRYSWCKKCEYEYLKGYRNLNPEITKEVGLRYRYKNRDTLSAKAKEYRRKNAETIREKDKNDWSLLKVEVLQCYGGNPPKCPCCGEHRMEFLTIDHIDGRETNIEG
jgi:hypothetical protein